MSFDITLYKYNLDDNNNPNYELTGGGKTVQLFWSQAPN